MEQVFKLDYSPTFALILSVSKKHPKTLTNNRVQLSMNAAPTHKTEIVFQLDHKPTWFENIAVRPNGALLVTRLDVPELWEVDPKTGNGRVILSIDAAKSLTGITELSPDVFAVAGGHYDLASGTVPGSYGIWIVDLGSPEPNGKLVTKIPDAGLINGIATWDYDTILAVDSVNGNIYKIDLASGMQGVILLDETMTPEPGAPFPLGINGIKIMDADGGRYIYYSNTSRKTFYRVLVDKDFKELKKAESIATGFMQDDFVLAEDGTAYVVTNPLNTVLKISPDGSVLNVAGEFSSMDVAGGTACAFGRSQEDTNTLYVVTSGALALPVDGNTEPAKIVKIILS
jgi:hypothetical protein